MIYFVRWAIGFCLGLLISRGFTRNDWFVAAVSLIAAACYVAFAVMCE